MLSSFTNGFSQRLFAGPERVLSPITDVGGRLTEVRKKRFPTKDEGQLFLGACYNIYVLRVRGASDIDFVRR